MCSYLSLPHQTEEKHSLACTARPWASFFALSCLLTFLKTMTCIIFQLYTLQTKREPAISFCFLNDLSRVRLGLFSPVFLVDVSAGQATEEKGGAWEERNDKTKYYGMRGLPLTLSNETLSIRPRLQQARKQGVHAWKVWKGSDKEEESRDPCKDQQVNSISFHSKCCAFTCWTPFFTIWTLYFFSIRLIIAFQFWSAARRRAPQKPHTRSSGKLVDKRFSLTKPRKPLDSSVYAHAVDQASTLAQCTAQGWANLNHNPLLPPSRRPQRRASRWSTTHKSLPSQEVKMMLVQAEPFPSLPHSPLEK